MSGLDGFGTSLARGNGAVPEVFTVIAGVTKIGGPSTSRKILDVSAHDSPNRHMQFIGGMKDGGEVSLDINYHPSSHDTLLDDYEAITPVNYRLTFPNGAIWAFPAVMSNFEPSAPYDDKLAASAKFKVAGKPLITPGV